MTGSLKIMIGVYWDKRLSSSPSNWFKKIRRGGDRISQGDNNKEKKHYTKAII
jgi:hypothetical protein